MIDYLKGILISKSENSPSGTNIVVEVNNIGYFVLTTRRVVESLPEEGQLVTIYTSLIHKEDSMFLCGFRSKEDRDLFKILQSVSGIGTKVALLLLDEFTAGELVGTVIAGDDKTLSRTKGVGPKLAKRIALELKEKLTNWRDKVQLDVGHVAKEYIESNEQSCLETESVLLSLGYSKEETVNSIKHALNLAKNKSDSEELLRYALQWLSNQ